MRPIEICDLRWTPSIVRDAVTDLLGAYHRMFNVYSSTRQILRELVGKSTTPRIIDLCSGRGMHLSMLNGEKVEVVATDLYPNRRAFDRLKEAGILPVFEPTDALNSIPWEGVRTMFSALHHFEPDKVRLLIARAAKDRQPFAFFEFTERSFKGLFGIVLGQVFAFLVFAFLHPISLKRLVLYYVIPVIPLVLLWDGIASCWRTYSPAELRDIARGVDGLDLVTGKIVGKSFFQPNITFVYGVPS